MKYTTETYNQRLEASRPDVRCVKTYRSTLQKVVHECQVCDHQWLVEPVNILHHKARCPNCKLHNRKDTYFALLKERRPDVVCVGEYVNYVTLTEHHCNSCDIDWMITPSQMITTGHACRRS